VWFPERVSSCATLSRESALGHVVNTRVHEIVTLQALEAVSSKNARFLGQSSKVSNIHNSTQVLSD
jgi:hypothetical protein